MDSMKLYFDVRDIFRAPRLALSGKKIIVFIPILIQYSIQLFHLLKKIILTPI